MHEENFDAVEEHTLAAFEDDDTARRELVHDLIAVLKKHQDTGALSLFAFGFILQKLAVNTMIKMASTSEILAFAQFIREEGEETYQTFSGQGSPLDRDRLH